MKKMKKPWKQQIVKKFVGTACCHWREKWREQQWYSDTTQDGISAIMFFCGPHKNKPPKENHALGIVKIILLLLPTLLCGCFLCEIKSVWIIPLAKRFPLQHRFRVQGFLCKSVCAKDCFLHFFCMHVHSSKTCAILWVCEQAEIKICVCKKSHVCKQFVRQGLGCASSLFVKA